MPHVIRDIPVHLSFPVTLHESDLGHFHHLRFNATEVAPSSNNPLPVKSYNHLSGRSPGQPRVRTGTLAMPNPPSYPPPLLTRTSYCPSRTPRTTAVPAAKRKDVPAFPRSDPHNNTRPSISFRFKPGKLLGHLPIMHDKMRISIIAIPLVEEIHVRSNRQPTIQFINNLL